MSEAIQSESMVLFLHGFGGSADHWAPVINRLPGSIRTLVIDLPGHGESPQILSDSFDRIVTGLVELIKTETDKPIIIAGHSFGGLLAQAIAIHHPELVASLVLVSTASQLSLHPELVLQLQQGGIDPSFIAAGFSESVPDWVQSKIIHDLVRMRVGETRLFSDLERLDFSEKLSSVNVPVMVIYGEDDPVVSPRRSRKLTQYFIDAKKVAMEGCGHYPHLENPEKIVSIFAEFFEENFV